MYLVKYFYEEPASLEVLTPDLDADARQRHGPALSLEAFLQTPRYHRGYLSGSHLATGEQGLTTVAPACGYQPPLLAWLAGKTWQHVHADGTVQTVDAETVRTVLQNPTDTALLTATAAPLPSAMLQAAPRGERRDTLAALRSLLDVGATACFPEPAHHGFDWSFFSGEPMRNALAAAFQAHPCANVRRFVIPFQQARSEHKFYFDAYDLDKYAAFEIH